MPSEQAEVRYTEEEAQEIRNLAKRLINPEDKKGHDKFVLGASITLLAARQVYMAALVDLDNRLKELPKIKEDQRDGIRATLVEAMQIQAQQQFTRNQLVDKIQRHVLPWLMATAQSESAKAAAAEAEEERKIDKRRRETLVPIGFPTEQDLPDDPKMLVRDRTLSLVGHPGAVKYLCRKAVEAALKQPENTQLPKLRVIHLSMYDKPYRNISKRGNKDRTHLVLGPDQWKHKVRNEKKFGEFMLGWCRMMRRHGIDLLVVDDLTEAQKPPTGSYEPFVVAANAHRAIRKWADRAGCAVICGLPLADWTGPGIPPRDEFWDMLEVYTTLRRIEVREGDYDEDYECDTYKIFFDNKALAADMVDRKIVDNYQGEND